MFIINLFLSAVLFFSFWFLKTDAYFKGKNMHYGCGCVTETKITKRGMCIKYQFISEIDGKIYERWTPDYLCICKPVIGNTYDILYIHFHCFGKEIISVRTDVKDAFKNESYIIFIITAVIFLTAGVAGFCIRFSIL